MSQTGIAKAIGDRTDDEPFVVAIGGGSAAGKTTLAEEVVRVSDNSTLISLDDYYQDMSYLTDDELSDVNLDHPDQLRWEILQYNLYHIKKGDETVQKPTYSFDDASVDTEEIEPGELVVIEGLWALDDRIDDFIDFRIYVEAEPDVRLYRRLLRDRAERGVNPDETVHWWKDQVKPMHREHVKPTRDNAHIIVDGGKGNEAVLEVIAEMIDSD